MQRGAAVRHRLAGTTEFRTQGILMFLSVITVAGKANGRTSVRPFGDIKIAML
jgi:hypothetical protein